MEFPVKVNVTCIFCGLKFPATVPTEIYMAPELVNVDPVIFSLKDLKNETSKIVRDKQGNMVGTVDLKDFCFMMHCQKCNKNSAVKITDLEFL